MHPIAHFVGMVGMLAFSALAPLSKSPLNRTSLQNVATAISFVYVCCNVCDLCCYVTEAYLYPFFDLLKTTEGFGTISLIFFCAGMIFQQWAPQIGAVWSAFVTAARQIMELLDEDYFEDNGNEAPVEEESEPHVQDSENLTEEDDTPGRDIPDTTDSPTRDSTSREAEVARNAKSVELEEPAPGMKWHHGRFGSYQVSVDDPFYSGAPRKTWYWEKSLDKPFLQPATVPPRQQQATPAESVDSTLEAEVSPAAASFAEQQKSYDADIDAGEQAEQAVEEKTPVAVDVEIDSHVSPREPVSHGLWSWMAWQQPRLGKADERQAMSSEASEDQQQFNAEKTGPQDGSSDAIAVIAVETMSSAITQPSTEAEKREKVLGRIRYTKAKEKQQSAPASDIEMTDNDLSNIVYHHDQAPDVRMDESEDTTSSSVPADISETTRDIDLTPRHAQPVFAAGPFAADISRNQPSHSPFAWSGPESFPQGGNGFASQPTGIQQNNGPMGNGNTGAASWQQNDNSFDLAALMRNVTKVQKAHPAPANILGSMLNTTAAQAPDQDMEDAEVTVVPDPTAPSNAPPYLGQQPLPTFVLPGLIAGLPNTTVKPTQNTREYTPNQGARGMAKLQQLFGPQVSAWEASGNASVSGPSAQNKVITKSLLSIPHSASWSSDLPDMSGLERNFGPEKMIAAQEDESKAGNPTDVSQQQDNTQPSVLDNNELQGFSNGPQKSPDVASYLEDTQQDMEAEDKDKTLPLDRPSPSYEPISTPTYTRMPNSGPSTSTHNPQMLSQGTFGAPELDTAVSDAQAHPQSPVHRQLSGPTEESNRISQDTMSESESEPDSDYEQTIMVDAPAPRKMAKMLGGARRLQHNLPSSSQEGDLSTGNAQVFSFPFQQSSPPQAAIPASPNPFQAAGPTSPIPSQEGVPISPIPSKEEVPTSLISSQEEVPTSTIPSQAAVPTASGGRIIKPIKRLRRGQQTPRSSSQEDSLPTTDPASPGEYNPAIRAFQSFEQGMNRFKGLTQLFDSDGDFKTPQDLSDREALDNLNDNIEVLDELISRTQDAQKSLRTCNGANWSAFFDEDNAEAEEDQEGLRFQMAVGELQDLLNARVSLLAGQPKLVLVSQALYDLAGCLEEGRKKGDAYDDEMLEADLRILLEEE